MGEKQYYMNREKYVKYEKELNEIQEKYEHNLRLIKEWNEQGVLTENEEIYTLLRELEDKINKIREILDQTEIVE